jgi:plasmid replication initiation protein
MCEVPKMDSTKPAKIARSPLLPDRHPEPDFFVCDIFDAVPKSDTASMENPLFSLSTKPDMSPRTFTRGKNWLKINPSAYGLATVHDKDILIYCISQCMAALNAGQPIMKTLRFNAHDLLTVTNRATNKKGYELLKNALLRLQGTQIETNITTGGKEQWDAFSFIDSARTIRTSRDGRMQAIEITLSDWVFNAINAKGQDLLTISREYFRLRKPLERRLYEIARKMCGKNKYWRLRINTLHEISGSGSSLSEFKRMIKSIIEENQIHKHIPDYEFSIKDELLIMKPRPEFTKIYSKENPALDKVILTQNAFEIARKHSNGFDVYFLEQEWRNMLQAKGAPPKNPDGSFVNYVKWYVQNNR